MSHNSHYYWLFCTLAGVALLVYFTPQNALIPLPAAPRQASTPQKVQTTPLNNIREIGDAGYMEFPSNRVPDSFSFYAGSQHAKAYAGFQRPLHSFPQYSIEKDLMEHP